MLRVIVLSFLPVLASFSVAAEEAPANATETAAPQEKAKRLTTMGDAKSLADEVMARITSGEVGPAMDLLDPHFPVSRDQRLALFNRISQARATAGQRFGAAVGHQFVKEEEVKDTLVRFTYVEKYESSVVRWTITFYKPKDAWLFYTVAWDGNLDALFS